MINHEKYPSQGDSYHPDQLKQPISEKEQKALLVPLVARAIAVRDSSNQPPKTQPMEGYLDDLESLRRNL